MRRLLTTLVLCALFAAAGAAGTFWFFNARRPVVPDPPALVEKMRDVARLETLDVSLYKKVSFKQPPPWLNPGVLDMIKDSLFAKEGKAIVFADVHLGLDFSRLDTRSVRVNGDSVEVTLPPIQASVELKPGETEVLSSNLSSEQTALLLQDAKDAFEREALNDPKLRARAKQSAERSLKGLLLSLGFREVRFVEALPPVEPG